MENQDFFQKYDRLPAPVREAMNSAETVQALRDLTKKNGLHIDDLMIISDLVGMVFMGDLRAGELGAELEKRLTISRTLANAVAKDLNDSIFYPVRAQVREEEGAETPVDEDEPESRDLILDSIENPESIPSVSRSTPLEVGVISPETPVVEPQTEASEPQEVVTTLGVSVAQAPTPQEEPPKPSILEQKRTKPFTTKKNGVTAQERINRDPYKESIE